MTNTPNPDCASSNRSHCPLACALDVVGDRWTLVVLRDLMFFDKHVFNEFLASPEGISTNILTQRLKKLESLGLVAKTQYQNRPARYRYTMTAYGETLRPVMLALIQWGRAHMTIPSAPANNR